MNRTARAAFLWCGQKRFGPPDGRFQMQVTKMNHRAYFKPRPRDHWLVIGHPCVLVQRTTAKEQPRRLVAAVLPAAFIRAHGGAVVENHLNMVRAVSRPSPSRSVSSRIGGFVPEQVAFVTAYADRGSVGFKKTVSRLAWGSFAWFASEPDHLVVQYEAIGGDVVLKTLLDPRNRGV